MTHVNARAVPNCPRACLYCRMRKVKCDGTTPCSNCVSHEKECYYPPSQRGKRSKARGRVSLEDRLAKMEAMIQQTSSFRESQPPESVSGDMTRTTMPMSTSTTATSNHTSSPQSARSALSTLVGPHPPPPLPSSRLEQMEIELGMRTPSNPYPALPSMYIPPSWTEPGATVRSAFSLEDRSLGELDQNDDETQEYTFSAQTQVWEHHGPGSWLSLCSEPGVSWVTDKVGCEDFAKSTQKLAAAWNRRWQFSTSMNRVGRSEPDVETAWKYCTAYFDHSFESIYGVVYRPEFEARLQAHFRQGGPSAGDDVAWYALRNTVYAAGCRQLLLKDHSTPYEEAQAEAYRYFQNALSVHTDLIYGPSGLEAIRALIAMSFYAEASANEGFEYMMCANAVRLAQAKGLHRQPSKSLNLSETEVMHRNWLFWAIFCLERLVSFRSGRPSATDDDNISCEIPTQAPPGSTIDVKFVTHAVKACRLASEIIRRLTSVRALRQSPADIIDAANDMARKIDVWREGVGADFQTPGKSIKAALLGPNVRPLHIIYLQVMYYLGIQSTYAIFALPWVGSILGLEKHPCFREEAAIKATKVAEAARTLILIAKAMDLDAAMPQWASFYFPTAALTNLFVYVLDSPTRFSAQADVALLDVAAGHFSHMEYLTTSQRGSPFTREMANLARATVERASRKPNTNVALPPLAAEFGDNGSTSSLFQPPEPFVGDQFDMEGWNLYSTVLIDGMMTGDSLIGIPSDG